MVVLLQNFFFKNIFGTKCAYVEINLVKKNCTALKGIYFKDKRHFKDINEIREKIYFAIKKITRMSKTSIMNFNLNFNLF